MEAIKKIMDRRFIRFLLVGALNTVFGYGVYALFVFIGLHFSLAAFIGTILGILFNFQTIGRLVFTSYKHHLIFKFIGVYFITYLINIFGIYLCQRAGLNVYIGGAILILPMAVPAYYLHKTFVFKNFSATYVDSQKSV